MPQCPTCDTDLDHEDTFGNLDHCLAAIGRPRRNGQPVKKGDIWRCPNAEAHPTATDLFYTIDGDPRLYEGYPC